MASLSITRLHLRSNRYLLPLLWHSLLSARQARRADGCLGVELTRRGGAFWTQTLWRDAAAMRAFMLSGPHRAVMPKLVEWCDEAAVARVEWTNGTLAGWDDAEWILAQHGRLSAVKHPSAAHAAGLKMGHAEKIAA
ncbi:MAG: hypothetical protein SFV19_02155 [Rhodospirillaceae bacterium]|nr:hypothetical protein [Rhodospirillaceae bacterium]